MSIEKCHVMELNRIEDRRGNLTFIQYPDQIPFPIGRVYYVYDVPGGAYRAGHAHLKLQQVIIAISGSFDVAVDDGHRKHRFHLNRSYQGLYIPPMIWREIDNFSSNSVLLAVVSDPYDEADYIRDHAAFLRHIEDVN